MTTQAPQARVPATGTQIAGKYRIEREIGRGGMGIVFEARSGPRPDAGRSNELRYIAGADEQRAPWLVVMLEGIPRAQAQIQLTLSYDRTKEAAEASTLSRSRGPATAVEIPNVSVFFGARNVIAKARDHTTIPMRAQGISFRAGRVALLDVEADVSGTGSDALRITPKTAAAVDIPRTGTVALRVAREDGGLTVEIAGKQLHFDSGTAAYGYIGIAIEGPGFVRVGQPKITALK